MKQGLKKPSVFKKLNIPGITYGLVLLFILFSILRPTKFLTAFNMMLILRNSAVLLVASIGMTMVILSSKNDMSIGAVVSLSGVIAATCVSRGMPIFLAVLIAMAAGVAVGFLNGVLIAYFNFDFWITTFGTMGVGAGLALVVAGGATVQTGSDTFGQFGNAKVGGVYVMLWFTVILIAVMMFVLRRTKFGYAIYSIGGSEQSARLSGVNVLKNRIAIYMCSGLFASVAGLMLASMSNSASPIAGADYSFDAIAAVVIGGTSFDGGKGGLGGTVLGVLLLRTLASGLNLLGVASTWQKAIIGLVIVSIIVAQVAGENVKKKNESRRLYADAE